MSFDFSIKAAQCDHLQTLERYVVSPYDNKSLLYATSLSQFMRAPLSGASLMKIYIGGTQVLSNDATYGWIVVPDKTSLSLDETLSKIMFRRSMRLSIPLIEVTYRTYKDYCLKCNGTGFVNDLKVQSSGSLLHIWGQNKLVQRSLKWVLTSTDGFYPQLVCHIKDYIGKKFGTVITDADISQEILNALTNMKTIQQAQMSVQSLDDGEIIVDVSSVTAVTDPNNPTLVRVSCGVISNQKIGAATNINFSLRVK